jgi:hypothetical protein
MARHVDMDLQLIRRVKSFNFGSLLEPPSVPTVTRQQKIRRLLRIEFKDPKEDYIFVHEIRSNQGMLVFHRKNRYHLAILRESFSPAPLQMLQVLARMQHPNVAEILDVYFDDGKLYIVGEHLDIPMLDLEFKRFAPEEWEIATIIAEVKPSYSYYTVSY